MASPQLEDGHTRIAHELLDAMMLGGLSQRQLLIALAVMRKTYGWSKKSDEIALDQFVALTGIKKNHVSTTIKELVERNILTREPGKFANRIGINKHYKTWLAAPKSGQGSDSEAASPKSGQGEACGAGAAEESSDSSCPESGLSNSGGELVPNQDNTLSQIGTFPCPESGTTKEDFQKQLPKAINLTPYPQPEKEKENEEMTKTVATQASSDAMEQEGLFVDLPTLPVATTDDADPNDWKRMDRKQKTAAVEEVYGFWRRCMNSPKSVLDGKRTKAIEKALNGAWTLRDVCKAIRGCSLDPWSMGDNDRSKPFNDITLILRDAKHIEDFMAYAESPPKVSAKSMNKSERAVADGISGAMAAKAKFAAAHAAIAPAIAQAPGGYVPPNDGNTLEAGDCQ
jgi:phage replication O-like protein O